MANRTPKEEIIWECQYQVVNQEVEIEILRSRLTPLKYELLKTEDKKHLESLNQAIMGLESDIKGRQENIKYFNEKIEYIEKRK